MSQPTTGDMIRALADHYGDTWTAKQRTLEIWRAQGRVLTYATAIAMHYWTVVAQDVERVAELARAYAKKREEVGI